LIKLHDALHQAAFEVAAHYYGDWKLEQQRVDALVGMALKGQGTLPANYWETAHAAHQRYLTAALILEEIETVMRDKL
jgi:hypothetical protein